MRNSIVDTSGISHSLTSHEVTSSKFKFMKHLLLAPSPVDLCSGTVGQQQEFIGHQIAEKKPSDILRSETKKHNLIHTQ